LNEFDIKIPEDIYLVNTFQR